MSRYSKDIIRLHHPIEYHPQLKSIQRDLCQIYGLRIRPFAVESGFGVSIVSRRDMYQANPGADGQRASNEALATALRSALIFDESSAVTAIARHITCWRTGAQRAVVGVRLDAPLFEHEFTTAKAAIQATTGIVTPWRQTHYDIGLGWATPDIITSDIRGAELTTPYTVEVERLHMTPSEFDPYA